MTITEQWWEQRIMKVEGAYVSDRHITLVRYGFFDKIFVLTADRDDIRGNISNGNFVYDDDFEKYCIAVTDWNCRTYEELLEVFIAINQQFREDSW
jgi:hypothetical protein